MDTGGLAVFDIAAIDPSMLLEIEGKPEVDVSVVDITVLESRPVMDASVAVIDVFEAVVVDAKVAVANVVAVVVNEVDADVDTWEELVVGICDPEVDKSELVADEPVCVTEAILKPEPKEVALGD
jgi:hypothetical protein